MASLLSLTSLALAAVALITICGGKNVGFEKLYMSQNTIVHQLPTPFEHSLPPYLRGTLVRNGPGRFEMGHRRFSHVFDGYAKLSSWNFLNETTTLFSTDFIASSTYTQSVKSNGIAPYMPFNPPIPDFNWLQKKVSLLRGGDNCPVSIQRFGTKENGTYVALTDAWPNYSFDPKSLKTTGALNAPVPGLVPALAKMQMPSTSHPLQEYNSENMITFVGVTNPMSSEDAIIRLVRITSGTDRELIRDIPVPSVPYMHSFGLSQNYAAIMAAPMYVDSKKIMSTSSPLQSMYWKPEDGMTIYVVNIHSKELFSVKTDAMFPMHFINSYEEGGFLYIDYVVYDDMKFISTMMIDALKNPEERNKLNMNCQVKRFTINLKDKTVKVTEMATTPGQEAVNKIDMPAVNPNFFYRKHCYVYGVAVRVDGENLSDTLLGKKDMCTSGNDRSWHLENHYAAEPIFVASPNSSEEDDGVLLSVVLDGEKGVSYLAIFDARSMALINRSYLPFHQPTNLHGKFFPDL